MVERKRKQIGGARSKSVVPVATPATVSRPEVLVEFLFDRGVLSIAVRNVGNRAALKVSVAWDRKIVGLGGTREISRLAMFRNIEFLGPGREVATLVDSSHAYFERGEPLQVSALVRYHDAEGTGYEQRIAHDLEIYRESCFVPHNEGFNS